MVFVMSAWLEAATPVNDHFTNATEIVLPAAYNFLTNLVASNRGATVEPGESLNPDLAAAGTHGTIWFRWTCPASGRFELQAYGENCAIAAGLFAGSSVSNLTTFFPPYWDGFGGPIMGKEELGGCWVWIDAVAGATYWLAVMSDSSEHGPCDDDAVRLDIIYSPMVLPANDDFANRTPLAGTNVAINGETRGGTLEPGEPASGIVSSVWYSWTAPTSGVAQVSFTTPDGYCPTFRAFYGNSVNALTLAAAGPGGGVYVKPGETLAIQVTVLTNQPCGVANYYTMNLWLEQPTPGSANDDFANRATIGVPEYQFTGSLYGAGSEPGEPLAATNALRTLWWTLTALTDGVLQVTPTSSQVWLLTQLFEGDALGSLALLPPTLSQTGAFRLQGGHTYSLQLSSANVPAGAFSLTTRFYPALTNDAFANSARLPVGTNVVISEWLLEASLEPGEPLLVTNLAKSVWWSWKSPVHGKITLTGGAAPIRAINVYEGENLGALQPVSVRVMPQGKVFIAEAGRTYQFQVMAGGTDSGPFNWSIAFQEFGPPATDDFANGRPLLAVGENSFESIVGASRELGEPDHLPGVAHQSIWWSIVPPINGRVSFDGTGGTYLGAVFVVYRGAAVDNLQPVAIGTNYVSFQAYGGETYHVAAVAPIGTIGDIRLTMSAVTRNIESRVVPGNLVQNYSFEELEGGTPIAHWVHTNEIGGVVSTVVQNDPPAADGVCYPVAVGQSIYQDLATIPGEPYRIHFAVLNWAPTTGAVVRVSFGTEVLPDAVNLTPQWRWFEHVATAQDSVTRLRITFAGDASGVDAVTVMRDNQPPTFITPPQSLSALEGSATYFHASVSGSAPLWYQWFFNDAPLADSHAATLLIQPVASNRVGTYQLMVTNRAGAITSAPVQLILESPTKPEILVQPQGDSVLLDQHVVLGVLADGTAPLYYQWFRNGAAMADATNRHLVMTNIQAADLASYTVLVSNTLGSALSLPATLTLAAAATNSGAYLVFDAYSLTNSATPKLTVRDLDGVTLLEGTNYVAQLYLGPSAEKLRPVTVPSPFFTSYRRGTWRRVTANLRTFSTNTPYAAQIRVWQTSAGETYEEARAAGGKFGRSVVFTLTIQPFNFLSPPESSIPTLPSFSLEAGRPGFNVGKLEWVERGLDGTAVWQLTGDPGFRYVVEKSNDSLRWQPFQILTNSTGTVRFTDPMAANANQSWYRSRILD